MRSLIKPRRRFLPRPGEIVDFVGGLLSRRTGTPDLRAEHAFAFPAVDVEAEAGGEAEVLSGEDGIRRCKRAGERCERQG